MKLEVSFHKLDKLRERMGAEYKEFSAPALRESESQIAERLSKEGIEVQIEDIKKERVGSFLVSGPHQILVYIKDSWSTINDFSENTLGRKSTPPKFHIVWCRTLQEMDQKKKFNRYIATRRTDGEFLIDVFKDETKQNRVEIEAPLLVCKNCLDHIEYQGYKKDDSPAIRNKIVEEFDIEAFLAEYENEIRYLKTPEGWDNAESISEYSDVFFKKSPLVKRKAGYCCRECGVNLSNHRTLLHCHHKNHKKNDNAWNNLEALCAECHGKHHPHMYVSPAGKKTLTRLRKVSS